LICNLFLRREKNMKNKSLTKRSYWLASLGMVIVLALAACQPELPAATPVPPDPTHLLLKSCLPQVKKKSWTGFRSK
jgi:hypothetical protein